VKDKRGWWVRWWGRCLRAAALLCKLLLLAWGFLAIYWSELPWHGLRGLLSAAFLIAGGYLLFVALRPRAFRVFAGVYAVILLAWVLKQPSHERDWRLDMEVMPEVVIDGDVLVVRGVRNFEYRAADEFDVRYEEREMRLSGLQAVDFFVAYWKPGPVAHTFVSFVFEDEPPLCVSIEARLEEGESYSLLASLFKESELIYIVGDERDIVGSRVDHRGHDVYLYRTNASPEQARALFLSYVEKINALAEEPEFYHLLSNNCTVNIVRHARGGRGRGSYDLRVMLNGFVDGYAYAVGVLDQSVPFEKLRGRALIEPGIGGDAAGYSERIRGHIGGVTEGGAILEGLVD